MNAIEKLNSELNRIFDIFNQKYFNGEINKPVILAQTNRTDIFTMGWCTTNKVWKDSSLNEYFYEITICAEYLYRNVPQICSTLLHEMVHLYNLQKGIKDTSRGNTYHNKRFKQEAEKRGLIIEYDKRIGWSITSLQEETKKFIEDNVNKDVFTVTRVRHRVPLPPIDLDIDHPQTDEDPGEEINTGIDTVDPDDEDYDVPYEIPFEEEKPKQSSRKYICPECKTIIRATKEVNVVCGDCNKHFVKEEK